MNGDLILQINCGRVNMNWNSVDRHLNDVVDEIKKYSTEKKGGFRYGQEDALKAIAERLSKNNGAVLADEVGLGKTRIALILMEAVLRAGGSVAAVVPRGLMFQWDSEAKELAKMLRKPHICRQIHKIANYDDLFNENIEYPISKGKNGTRWCLISHSFGMFKAQVKRPQRYALWSKIAYKLRTRGKKYWGDLFSMVFEKKPSARRDYAKKEKEAKIYKEKIELAVSYLGKTGLIKKQTLPSFKNRDCINRRDKYVKPENIKKAVFDEENGLQSAKKVIGTLIGKIDFLVIDEAHKSKEQLDGKERKNILTTLLRDIIQYPKGGSSKILCMTATPIELGANNWLQLLERCNIHLSEDKKKCIETFYEKLDVADANSDNRMVLRALMDASINFEKTLRNYVVRRRRCKQKEHKELVDGLLKDPKCKGLAHPYRMEKMVEIDRSKLSLNWQKAILCYDGASWAAKGLSRGTSEISDASKRLQCKLSTGGYDYEKDERNIDDIVNPKEKRLAFWLDRGNEFANKDSANGRMHPRVQKTADFIEELLKNNKEKVLVFGTFTKPMNDLRDELNYRYIARRIESNQLLKHDLKGNEKILNEVFSVYNQLYGKDGRFAISKKGEAAFDLFKQTALRLNIKYKNLQKTISDILNNQEETLIVQLSEESRNDEQKILLQHIQKNKELSKLLFESVKEDVLNSFVDADDSINENNPFPSNKVRNEFKKQILACLSDVSDSGEATGEKDEKDKIKALEESLNDYLKSKKDDEMGLRTSAYCRLMDGDTDWNTRRRIQRQFNTENSSPRVLIAQSRVGREGLNLHTCCRKVVLFHQEWNPGVVEQQIGRVDRIDSLWNKMAKKWKNGEITEFPKIEVYYVVFSGTYDQHQYDVLKNRSIKMNAQLFGALLSEEALEKVPEGIEKCLADAAPNFDPAVPRRMKANNCNHL